MPPRINAATLLTIARLILAPIFAWTFLHGEDLVAFLVFLAAALTDALDGLVARRFHLATEFGTKLDPIADKVFLATVFLSLSARGVIPAWLLAIVILRDLALLAGSAAAIRWHGVDRFPPTPWGKISTFLQITYVVAALLGKSGRTGPWGGVQGPLGGIVALVTIASGIHYVWRGWAESNRRR